MKFFFITSLIIVLRHHQVSSIQSRDGKIEKLPVAPDLVVVHHLTKQRISVYDTSLDHSKLFISTQDSIICELHKYEKQICLYTLQHNGMEHRMRKVTFPKWDYLIYSDVEIGVKIFHPVVLIPNQPIDISVRFMVLNHAVSSIYPVQVKDADKAHICTTVCCRPAILPNSRKSNLSYVIVDHKTNKTVPDCSAGYTLYKTFKWRNYSTQYSVKCRFVVPEKWVLLSKEAGRLIDGPIRQVSFTGIKPEITIDTGEKGMLFEGNHIRCTGAVSQTLMLPLGLQKFTLENLNYTEISQRNNTSRSILELVITRGLKPGMHMAKCCMITRCRRSNHTENHIPVCQEKQVVVADEGGCDTNPGEISISLTALDYVTPEMDASCRPLKCGVWYISTVLTAVSFNKTYTDDFNLPWLSVPIINVTCIIRNRVTKRNWTKSQSFNYSSPPFDITFSNSSVELASNTSVICTAKGFPKPKVEWRFLDRFRSRKRFYLNGSTLFVKHSRFTGSFILACSATNKIGNITFIIERHHSFNFPSSVSSKMSFEFFYFILKCLVFMLWTLGSLFYFLPHLNALFNKQRNEEALKAYRKSLKRKSNLE